MLALRQSDRGLTADEGLTLETSAFLLFTVAYLRFHSVVNTKLPAIKTRYLSLRSHGSELHVTSDLSENQDQ